MKRFIIGIVIVIAVLAVGYRQELLARFRTVPKTLQNFSTGLAQRAEEQVSLPEPLRKAARFEPQSLLSHSGVVALTNKERQQQGLLALTESDLLNKAAKQKLDDMFAKQYFEHVSPTGVGPSDLAKSVGYSYVAVGENLAEGGFTDDIELLQGWMNSPGHRANILNKQYQNIGVAVGQGLMNGIKVWLAVQEFGTPLSACPPVDEQIKNTINANESDINQRKLALEAEQKNLSQQPGESYEQYRSRVDAYNAEVSTLNNLIDRTKELVNRYNAQVSAFNACVNK